MGTLSLETRKTRLLHHIYNQLLEDGNTYKWIDVLDALDDVLQNNKIAMKYWTVTRDGELVFR